MENSPWAVRSSKLESDTRIEGERHMETVNKSSASDEVSRGSKKKKIESRLLKTTSKAMYKLKI